MRAFVFPFRDGQSGKVTADDYGARTGKSPGKMRQLNINGDLYVGECSPSAFRTQVHFLCLQGQLQGRASQLCLSQGEGFMQQSGPLQPVFCGEPPQRGLSWWDGGDVYEKGPAPWGAL